MVRVTLDLPLYCDPDRTTPLEVNSEQTILVKRTLVQADVALCGDERSFRQVADNQ